MAGNRFERNLAVCMDTKSTVLNVQRVSFEKNHFDYNLYWAPGGRARTNFESIGPDEGENLVQAFSGANGTLPTGWGWSAKPAGAAAVLKEVAEGQVLEVSGNAADNQTLVVTGPKLELEWGGTYRLRARLRANEVAEAYLGVHCYVPKRPFWMSGQARREVGTEWAEYEWTFVVPKEGKPGWHEELKQFNVRVGWKAGRLEVADVQLHRAVSKSEWDAWIETGADAHSVVADPQFEDLGTFRLGKSSPAWALGFEAIPFEKIGPRPE
jgi:hypothetical protein